MKLVDNGIVSTNKARVLYSEVPENRRRGKLYEAAVMVYEAVSNRQENGNYPVFLFLKSPTGLSQRFSSLHVAGGYNV